MKIYFGLMALIILFSGCTHKKYDEMKDFYKTYGNNSENIDTHFEILAKRKVYFGHQSVGYNIIDGINQLQETSSTKLDIIESKEFANTDSIPFIHFTIGQNRDPFSKIDEFGLLMNEISKDTGAIAFFKFCYIDITKDTDIEPVFNYYKEKLLDLKEKHPHVTIVLVTVPLRALQKGIKGIIKRILFIPLGEKLDNIKRIEFNTMLVNSLGKEFPIFDLAKIEATKPDGTLNQFEYQGKVYYSMPYLYTRDQGHLNEYGAKIVAANLISFLSQNELLPAGN